MSSTAVTKKEPGIPQLVITLFAICAICAILLGLINMITMDPIEKAKQAKTENAMKAVLTSDTYEPVEYTGDPIVTAVYKAGDAGYVVEAAPSGFGGAIIMMVGVNTDGTVSGVSFVKLTTETSGLGSNAKKDVFWGQYVGGAGPFAVTKDGGDIDSITGATITSRAVTKGVNAALDAVKAVG